MALDLGLTTRQLLSARDGVASAAVSRGRRLGAAIDRALAVASNAAASALNQWGAVPGFGQHRDRPRSERAQRELGRPGRRRTCS